MWSEVLATRTKSPLTSYHRTHASRVCSEAHAVYLPHRLDVSQLIQTPFSQSWLVHGCLVDQSFPERVENLNSLYQSKVPGGKLNVSHGEHRNANALDERLEIARGS